MITGQKKTYEGWTGTIQSIQNKVQLGVYTWSSAGDPFDLNIRNICVGGVDSCPFSYKKGSCPAEGDWKETQGGEIASLPCPDNNAHLDKQRKCKIDGTWDTILDGCTTAFKPTCSDGKMNGNEIDVDCGGSCEPCSECSKINCGTYGTCSGGKCSCKLGYSGTNCETPPSCTLSCQNKGVCQLQNGIPKCVCLPNYSGTTCQTALAGTCNDGKQNQGETGIDCGGVVPSSAQEMLG
eukprot:TRINITY_DN1725_c0_g1_i1.p1 TRINITY_DN1725_c0_g1~~TRINITY_DN1725_c0_g1_i1.p1  ORF type:complete len:237 (+),score=43.12 TRINITY_DN1725_c0_g1_i1:395-1105(+)